MWKKIIDWFNASHRWQHLALGYAYGLAADDWYCAAYGGLGVAGALELKDVLWANTWKAWDWADFGLTIAGVAAGYTTRHLLFGR